MVRIHYRAIFFKLVSWQMFCMTMTFFIEYLLHGIYKNPFYTALYNLLLTIVYMIFIYNEMWHIGQKDRNMVNLGCIERERGRGLLSALLASIPNIALILLFGLDFSGLVDIDLFSALFMLWNIFMVSLIRFVSERYFVLYFLVFIPAFVACPLGYRNGYNGKSMLGKVLYKSRKKE